MMINGKVSAKKMICKCNAISGKCKWKNEKNKKISTASFQKWKCAAVTSTLAITSTTTLTASPITDVPNTSSSVTSEPDTTASTTITTTQSATTSSALTTIPAFSPIPSDYDFVETSFGYIFYKSFNPASRSEARQTCENENSTLPIPRSAEENNIYIQLASYEINWLGMSDSKEEGVWKADDGKDVIWFNWREGEPKGNCRNSVDFFSQFSTREFTRGSTPQK